MKPSIRNTFSDNCSLLARKNEPNMRKAIPAVFNIIIFGPIWQTQLTTVSQAIMCYCLQHTFLLRINTGYTRRLTICASRAFLSTTTLKKRLFLCAAPKLQFSFPYGSYTLSKRWEIQRLVTNHSFYRIIYFVVPKVNDKVQGTFPIRIKFFSHLHGPSCRFHFEVIFDYLSAHSG